MCSLGLFSFPFFAWFSRQMGQRCLSLEAFFSSRFELARWQSWIHGKNPCKIILRLILLRKHLCVSKNRSTPKWMVYNGKPYWNGWFGGTTIFGNIHLSLTIWDGRNPPQLHPIGESGVRLQTQPLWVLELKAKARDLPIFSRPNFAAHFFENKFRITVPSPETDSTSTWKLMVGILSFWVSAHFQVELLVSGRVIDSNKLSPLVQCRNRSDPYSISWFMK